MSGEQIYLQVPPKLFESTAGSNRWSGSKPVGLATKMHRSQKCCGKLAELKVDGIWQIADAGETSETGTQ